MPCTDGGVPYPPSKEEVWQQRMADAGLCACLRWMQSSGYADEFMEWVMDDHESGLSKTDFKKWWKAHCVKDAKRKGFDA